GTQLGVSHQVRRLQYYCTYRASILERTPVGVPFATGSRRSGSCECHVESGCRSARVLPPSFRSCSSAVVSGRAVPMWARSAIGGSPSIEPRSSISRSLKKRRPELKTENLKVKSRKAGLVLSFQF